MLSCLLKGGIDNRRLRGRCLMAEAFSSHLRKTARTLVVDHFNVQQILTGKPTRCTFGERGGHNHMDMMQMMMLHAQASPDPYGFNNQYYGLNHSTAFNNALPFHRQAPPRP